MNPRLAAAYVTASLALAFAVVSLHLPWSSDGPRGGRLFWDRVEGPPTDNGRNAQYFFADPNVSDLLLFQAAAVAAGTGTGLLLLLGPLIAFPMATSGSPSRLAAWTAGVAGLGLVAALPLSSAADSIGFGPGSWLCGLAGCLALVSASRLASEARRDDGTNVGPPDADTSPPTRS